MKKVVIIGAGIVGATSAYVLSKKGIDVTIVDAHMEGRATSAAAGIISPWVTKRRNKAWYTLARNGAKYYHSMMTDLEKDGFHDTGYKQVGAIRLHKDREKLEELLDIAIKRREDAPEMGQLYILEHQDVANMFPLIDEDFYGLWIEGAARVDGRKLRDSLLKAAEQHGAHLVKDTAILTKDAQGNIHATVAEEKLIADNIIVTNGVWMKDLFTQVDIDLHVQAQKGEIIHLQTENIQTENLPVIMPPTNQYMLSFDNGKIVIGASHRHVEQFDTSITAEGMHYILDEAFKITPRLKESIISEIRVGFRPFTPNHLPVFGPVPNQEHVLLATGLGASGLTTGPYIGKQLAKLAADETTDIPIEAYTIEQIIR